MGSNGFSGRPLIRFLCGLLPLFILFFIGELVLRFLGYQYLHDYHVYVSHQLHRSKSEPIIESSDDGYIYKRFHLHKSYPVKKSKDEFRIFFVGDSVLEDLSALSIMQKKTDVLYGKKVQIVNAALSSTGSGRAVAAVEQILPLNPDLIFVYTGHNDYFEFIGEKILQNYNLFSPLKIWIHDHLRILQWFARTHLYYDYRNLYGNQFTYPDPYSFLFPVDSTGKLNRDVILERFESNLEKIAKLGRNFSVPIVFSTITYNREFFLKRLQVDTGENDRLKPYPDSRIGLLEIVERYIDDTAAKSATRFTNHTIREVAKRNNVALIDIDAIFLQDSDLPGYGLFKDHIHFSPKGAQLIQEAWARFVQQNFDSPLSHPLYPKFSQKIVEGKSR